MPTPREKVERLPPACRDCGNCHVTIDFTASKCDGCEKKVVPPHNHSFKVDMGVEVCPRCLTDKEKEGKT